MEVSKEVKDCLQSHYEVVKSNLDDLGMSVAFLRDKINALTVTPEPVAPEWKVGDVFRFDDDLRMISASNDCKEFFTLRPDGARAETANYKSIASLLKTYSPRPGHESLRVNIEEWFTVVRQIRGEV